MAIRLSWLSITLALAVCLLSSKANGWSAGRWNMPSTNAQYFGYGYGPGHHAPMLRMPCCHPNDGRRLAFTLDCPQNQCSTCGMHYSPSTMYREVASPVEVGPTPAPPMPTESDHSRYVPPNLFLR